MKRNRHLRQIVLCALFTALTCLATVAVQMPAPVVGYIHLGDCMVLCAAFLQPPAYGVAAAGIGSALADFILGFAIYAPATLVIKALFAIVAFCLSRALRPLMPLPISRLIGGVAGGTLMTLGYFAYEAWLLGYGMAAAANIPLNLVQAGIGVALSVILVALLQKNPRIIHILLEE